MLVADASVLIKVLTREEGTEVARAVLLEADRVIAPDLVKLEVASGLSKKVRYHGLPREQAVVALEALPQFVSDFIPFDTLITPSFDLSLRLAHAIQDCVYLALAVEQDCQLATNDQRFAARARAADMDDMIVVPGELK